MLSTYYALTPWTDKRVLPTLQAPTGTKRIYDGSSTSRNKPAASHGKSESVFTNLWNRELQPEKQENPITGFLNKPRIK